MTGALVWPDDYSLEAPNENIKANYLKCCLLDSKNILWPLKGRFVKLSRSDLFRIFSLKFKLPKIVGSGIFFSEITNYCWLSENSWPFFLILNVQRCESLR